MSKGIDWASIAQGDITNTPRATDAAAGAYEPAAPLGTLDGEETATMYRPVKNGWLKIKDQSVVKVEDVLRQSILLVNRDNYICGNLGVYDILGSSKKRILASDHFKPIINSMVHNGMSEDDVMGMTFSSFLIAQTAHEVLGGTFMRTKSGERCLRRQGEHHQKSIWS